MLMANFFDEDADEGENSRISVSSFSGGTQMVCSPYLLRLQGVPETKTHLHGIYNSFRGSQYFALHFSGPVLHRPSNGMCPAVLGGF